MSSHALVQALDLRQADAATVSLRARSNLGQDVKFDLVCCQLALHYFFESAATFENFARVVVDSLKPGGRWVCNEQLNSKLRRPTIHSSHSIWTQTQIRSYLLSRRKCQHSVGQDEEQAAGVVG